MNVILIGGVAVYATDDAVELLADRAVIGGEHFLCFNDTMQTAEVDELPEPWVAGAYKLDQGAFVLLENSTAWQAHQASAEAAAEAAFEAGVAEYMAAVQAHMDAHAQSFGYDNLVSVVSYAEEPAVPRYQAEGKAFRAWRSKCWYACEQVLQSVKNGDRQPPAVAELLLELPAAPVQEPLN